MDLLLRLGKHGDKLSSVGNVTANQKCAIVMEVSFNIIMSRIMNQTRQLRKGKLKLM